MDPTKYTIELRNKAGNLIQYLTPWANDVSWEWNRKGGCGRCKINLVMPYRKITFNAMDDIRIRIKDGAASKLVYRGFIAAITPKLKIGQEITLDVRGYFDLLKFIVVQNNGDDKQYSSIFASDIVHNLIDTFVVPNTDITKGPVAGSSFTVDSIVFKESVAEILRTLADLLGNIEYGVDENLEFFWLDEGQNLRHKFFVGNNVEVLDRKTDFSRLVNKIYFEGGEVGGSPFLRTAANTDSINTYFLAEDIVVNSSITTPTVADQYLTAILNLKSTPKFLVRIRIPNTRLRLEDILPIGKVSVFDSEYDAGSASRVIIGRAINGGDDVIIGRLASGGSNVILGGGSGLYQDQIDVVRYSLSETEERFDIEVSMGGTTNEVSAKLKQLELLISNVRQRA